MKNLGFYLENFFDFFKIEFPPILVFEFQNFVISMLNNKPHIIVFTIYTASIFVLKYLSLGFLIEMRTVLNRNLGARDLKGTLRDKKIFGKFFLILAFCLGLLPLAILSTLEFSGVYGDRQNEVRRLMSLVKYLLFIRIFSNVLFFYEISLIKFIKLSDKAVKYFSIPYCLMNISSYLLGIYFNYGVLGMICYEIFFMGNEAYLLRVFLADDLFLEAGARAIEDYHNNLERD